MKSLLRCAAVLLPLAALPQMDRQRLPERQQDEIVLPNGKSQKEEILKAEHKKNLKDLDQLIAVAEKLRDEMEKNDRHVLSLGAIKKTEEIEKLARTIRSRMRH